MEKTMAKRHTFDAEKAHLDEACQALRWFTLARRGATRQSGIRAVARVNAVCKRMNDLFSKGPEAIRLASLLNSVRGQILAAEARLTLLTRKPSAAGEIS
jgi:hypothetical protein